MLDSHGCSQSSIQQRQNTMSLSYLTKPINVLIISFQKSRAIGWDEFQECLDQVELTWNHAKAQQIFDRIDIDQSATGTRNDATVQKISEIYSQTVRGRARSIGRMIQFSSINPWFSIHVDLTIFVWSLNLRSFEQQHQFNRKIKVKQVFLRNLLQFPWSRNIFARHVASRILWRSGFTGSNPILVLLLQKFKKVAQKVIKKRVPFVSNTRG